MKKISILLLSILFCFCVQAQGPLQISMANQPDISNLEGNLVQELPSPDVGTETALFVYNHNLLRKPKITERLMEEVIIHNVPLQPTIESRIACDGSKSTTFKLKVNTALQPGGGYANPALFDLEIQEGPDAGKFGELKNRRINGDSLIYDYTHPTYFGGDDKTKQDYKIHLDLYEKENEQNTKTTSIPIRIVRPSVVMVGGIFGSVNTFKVMDNQLTSIDKLYHPYQIKRLHYVSDEHLFFPNASYHLPIGIKFALDRCFTEKISAAKVDIVCHSMGGLISRTYLQSLELYNKDVNKLITLNTPHSGSQITNLLLCPNHEVRFWLNRLTKLIMGGDTYAGAAYDMTVDGPVIMLLNAPGNLDNNEVPIHVLCSTLDEEFIKETIEEASNAVRPADRYIPLLSSVIYFTGMGTLEFFHNLYISEPHDIAVPISSQRGGLNEGQTTFPPGLNIIHPGSSDDVNMITKVRSLLNAPPEEPDFTKGKLHPPQLLVPDILIHELAERASLVQSPLNTNNVSNSTVSISGITPGTAVVPGTVLSIQVTGSNDIQNIQVSAGNSKIAIYSEVKQGPSNIFQYKVPEDAAGRVNLIALGFHQSGMVGDTSIYIVVNPMSALTNIKVYPDLPVLHKGISFQLNITGIYGDQIERDITDLPGVTVVTSMNGRVSYLGSGRIIGTKVGNDFINIEYSGKSITVPVTVLEYTFKGNGLLVSVKALLQGPYNSAAGLMTDSLRSNFLLPDYQPYQSLGFEADSNTTFEIPIEGIFDSTGNKGITDWVWLELRSSTDPSKVITTRSAFIRRDGNVVDMDGSSPVYFNDVLGGNYYIAIRHRNHLGVMTAFALTLNNTSSTSIDFTSPATATYGTNAQRNINGVMVMWAGDLNGDKRVKYNGSSNDKNAVLSKVGLATPNNVLIGYYREDANLDGKLRYNGSANDKNVILGVVGLSTPNNVIIEQIPN